MRKIRSSLSSISEEVEDALDSSNIPNEPTWKTTVNSYVKPVTTKENFNLYENVKLNNKLNNKWRKLCVKNI